MKAMTRSARLALAAAALTAVVSAACQPPPRPALVGRSAPEVLLSAADSGVLQAARARGDILVLAFFTTWCPVSAGMLRTITELAAQTPPLGVFALAVDEDEGSSAAEGAAFVARSGLRLAVGVDTDGAIASAMAFETLPALVIVDRQGIVRHVHTGYHGEKDRLAIGEEVAALALEPPPSSP
jgi:peroxiredoxin